MTPYQFAHLLVDSNSHLQLIHTLTNQKVTICGLNYVDKKYVAMGINGKYYPLESFIHDFVYLDGTPIEVET